jgi:hypothetical protein
VKDAVFLKNLSQQNFQFFHLEFLHRSAKKVLLKTGHDQSGSPNQKASNQIAKSVNMKKWEK